MFHLAQANVARFKGALDDPIMKEFVDFLEPVNKFAEESEGFVWRLKDEEGRSSSFIESPFSQLRKRRIIPAKSKAKPPAATLLGQLR